MNVSYFFYTPCRVIHSLVQIRPNLLDHITNTCVPVLLQMTFFSVFFFFLFFRFSDPNVSEDVQRENGIEYNFEIYEQFQQES